ncbi:substrate-binding domain-containing protein [filamentous cyanobacterium LEGE 11480]|uniref:Substrate-binding domain-containing protein n=1 Tax=Romeriopsis navalis LEGE 11480 TaxID=2777977 RepID=A0A928VNH7_9CYAN|nr:substrate-binding domain-containing protein [Romeriopsis navalis]MBE9029124.1 substrate-binding domain-containing protein [Romeriopsis navalis LEGE 11480]
MVQMRSASVVNLALLTTLTTVAAPWVAANAFPSFPQQGTVAGGTNVRIQGSSNLNPLNQSLKKGFEQKYAGAKVSVANQGTAAALNEVAAGKADLAAIGRPLNDAEKAKGLVAVPVGRDKIAIVVGKKNPFKKDLTIKQFAQLFRGEAKTWKAVGGPNNAVRFVDRVTTDTRVAFPNYPAFKGKKLASGATAVKVEDEKPAAMSAKLGANGVSFLPASLLAGQKDIRVLTMHGVAPTDQRYPFSQPLFYVYKGAQPNPAVQAFLGFAGAKAGQSAIAASGVKQPVDFNKQATGAKAAAPAAAKATGDQAKADAAKAKAKAKAKAAAAAKAQADAKAKTDAKAQADAKAKAAAKAKADAAAKADAKPPADAKAQADVKAKADAAKAAAAAKSGEKVATAPANAPAATKVEPADAGAAASNQIAIGEETGRGIPPWLWWLLLPLGLLGLLLWLLPKDEEDDVLPSRSATGSTTRLGGVGNAVDTAKDTVGDAANAGGAAAAGAGAAIAGAGAAAMARLRGNKDQLDDATPDRALDSEWEPGTGDQPEVNIETPDWNLNADESAEVVADDPSWAESAKNAAGDAVDGTKDSLGNVFDAGGAAVAGAGAAAAGLGGAAWSRLRGNNNDQSADLNAGEAAEAEWEFEGELPSASTEVSSRMADFAPDGNQPDGGNLLDRAKDAVGGAVDGTKDAASNLVDGAKDVTGNTIGNVQSGLDNGVSGVTGAVAGATGAVTEGVGSSIDRVSATSANLTDTAGETAGTTSGWLKSLFGKAKDAAGDATQAAAGVGDKLKDGVTDAAGSVTGTAAAGGAAAVAGLGAAGAAVGAAMSGAGRVVMVPYNSREALVRWEMAAAAQTELRQQGGNQLVLRLYDVTDMDSTATDLPTFEQFDVDESAQEQRILIPQRDRTYMTVLGYLTRSGGFLEVSRSESVQIPAS